jgi:dipeptidyl aminopeptidase/acylaminoacyl peptidase
VQTANDSNRPNFVAPIYAYEKAILGTRIPSVQTPIFVAAASDDNLGFASHSVDIYTKWLNAKQPAELHMYEKGGHGFGMRKLNTTSDRWILDFEAWLKSHGLITE